MGRRDKDCNGRDYRECSEGYKTQSVQHHGGEFPIILDGRRVFVVPDLVRDHPQLLEDQAELSVRPRGEPRLSVGSAPRRTWQTWQAPRARHPREGRVVAAVGVVHHAPRPHPNPQSRGRRGVGVAWVVRMDVRGVTMGQCRAGPEIVVHVKDVGQEALGAALLQVELLHFVLHHDSFAGDLLPRAAHA